MIKRIALLVGGIAAAGVLALGLAAAGFGPAATIGAGDPDAEPLAAAAVPEDAALADVPAGVEVQTETVYVRPAPKPEVVHVTRKVAARQKASVGSRQQAKRRSDDDDDDGDHREREDRDDDDGSRDSGDD